MQSVLDNMSDGVTLFDSDYRLKFTNSVSSISSSCRPKRSSRDCR